MWKTIRTVSHNSFLNIRRRWWLLNFLILISRCFVMYRSTFCNMLVFAFYISTKNSLKQIKSNSFNNEKIIIKTKNLEIQNVCATALPRWLTPEENFMSTSVKSDTVNVTKYSNTLAGAMIGTNSLFKHHTQLHFDKSYELPYV